MTRTLVTAIVSTAAAGAERGALDAAIELELGYGGWTSEPDLPEIYASHAKITRDRGLAVRLNVQDSEGTLIVSMAPELTGRALHAANQAKAQRKPCKHLVLPGGGATRIRDAVRSALLDWIDERHISVLHIVGPGEDTEPGIGQATRDALVWVLESETAIVPVAVDPIAGTFNNEDNQPQELDFKAIARSIFEARPDYEDPNAGSITRRVPIEVICEHPGQNGVTDIGHPDVEESPS